ncbi:MAG: DUF11 domain-containing protein, partial [Sulfitobacter sp.]|nr:DUF11 domain-containing protein [Sulfitobacter sp.]
VASANQITSISVGPGQSAIDNNFGEDLGSIGDQVWLDINGDGIQDASETNGVAGFTVRLYDASSNLVATTTTDSLGNYLFDGLTAGVYKVEFDLGSLPTGYPLTVQDAGSNDALDSDADPLTGRTDPITLVAGEDNSDVDSGVSALFDLALRKTSDSLDSLLPGEQTSFTITVFNQGQVAAADIAVVDYIPTGLNLVSTNGWVQPVAGIASNTIAGPLLAGASTNLSIVFNVATNFSGVITNYAEIAGAIDLNGVSQTDYDSTFDSLNLNTESNVVDDAIDNTDGDEDDHDVAIVRTLLASVGNYVWLDEDRDGIQDAGEDGIANVMVIASNIASGVVYTNWTDANGEYLFVNIPTGDYTVSIPASNLSSGAPLDGMGQTQTALPGEDFGNQVNPYSTTLSGGKKNLTADFGFNFNPTDESDEGAIGDRVWLDVDGNGAQDAGEIGISDVQVVLYGDPDQDGTYDTPMATNTTDATGHYMFTNLVAGAYVVGVDDSTLPAILLIIGLDQTGDPDDFGIPATFPDHQTTTPLVLAPGDVFVNADFGYQPADGAGAIGDTVWLDLNADGTEDVGEPGIPGVSVNLIHDSNSNKVWDAGEPIIATDSTDENGEYLFSGLLDGYYLVQIGDVDNVLGGLEQTGDPD